MVGAILLVLAGVAAAPAPANAPVVTDREARHGLLTGIWQIPAQRGSEADPSLRIPAREPPPLIEPHASAYRARREAFRAAEEQGAPLATERVACVPDGFPRMMGTTLPIEFIESPGKITLIVEFNTQVRHIYLGGRHPPEDELEFGFFGHSIGRWEGDMLVVETVGIQPSTLLFDDAPHGERLRVEERFRFRTPDLIELSITMTDPDYLERPWTVTRLLARQPGMRLREFVCQQNNRNFRAPDGTIATEIRE